MSDYLIRLQNVRKKSKISIRKNADKALLAAVMVFIKEVILIKMLLLLILGVIRRSFPHLEASLLGLQ